MPGVALLEEDGGKVEEEPGVIGVKGLLENGGGPDGVDLLLVVELAVLVKMFAFSKLANEGCDMDAGACALVGEAKGSLVATDELDDCPPRSANRSNEAEGFVVEFLAPPLALTVTPPAEPGFWVEETFGRDTDELRVAPATLLDVSLLGVEALEEFALDV